MFHKTNLGRHADAVISDINGFVPQRGDDPFSFAFDHGCEKTHDEDGKITDYGRWWAEERFPELCSQADAEVAEIESAIQEWRESSV